MEYGETSFQGGGWQRCLQIVYGMCAQAGLEKDILNLQNLLFVSYDLESCEVFTQLGVNNKQQFFFLF